MWQLRKTDENFFGLLFPFSNFPVALCFKPGINTDSLLRDRDDSGIFHWDKKTLEKLGKNAVLGGTMKEKKLSMIAFLIEIGYDLMLSNEHNVSTSPGFKGAGLKKKQQ